MIKRGIILIFMVLSLVLVFAGCLSIHFGNGQMVVGNGEMESKTVTVEKEVTGLFNMGSIDVVIDPELDGEAVIEAESNIIEFVELEQDASGALTVSFEDGISVSLSRGVTVHIPAVNGGDIQVDGSGSISLDGDSVLKGDAFHISVEGSGDISLKMETANLEASVDGSGDLDLVAVSEQMKADISGSGRILMTGYADYAEISINGSGDFDGFECAMTNADISGMGSGNINVNVSGSLTGRISGSGDVVYDGNPTSVNITASGSGDALKR